MACRFHEVLDTLVGAGSRGRARNARNRPCTSRPGIVGPRVDSPGTSTAPTCSSPRPDPAPCVIPRARPSTRLLPEISFCDEVEENGKIPGDSFGYSSKRIEIKKILKILGTIWWNILGEFSEY